MAEACQAALEADYLRMCRLRRMGHGELWALLAGDPTKARPWIEAAARHGLAEAQLRLGQMLLDGHGAPRDCAAALGWFMRAAASGAAEAMNMVGRCCENGWGAAVDLPAAALWYERSAQAGHDWGEYNYANMLFDGSGVEADRVEAVRWYRRAADRGHSRAMNLLARCCEEGWGTRRDAASAAMWYRRSAEAGYSRAQVNHASVLANKGHSEAALAWLRRAREAAPPGDLRAMIEAVLLRSDRCPATGPAPVAP
jgi:TPR repeat protein